MTTAVTIEVLRQHLEDFGWSRYAVTPEPGEQEGLIFTGYIGDKDHLPHTIIIDPIVEKGVLRIFAPEVASAPPQTTDPKRLHELVYAIAALNARSALATFAYNPLDGDVVVSVSMPIEENDISFEQFRRSMEAVIWGISVFGPGLRDIIDGKATAEQVIHVDEPTATPAQIEMLRRLLEELEQRVRGGGEQSDEDEPDEETA